MSITAAETAALQAAYAEIVAWYDVRPSVRPDIHLKTDSIVLEDEGFVDVALQHIDAIAQRHGLTWSVRGTLDGWMCHVFIYPRWPGKCTVEAEQRVDAERVASEDREVA